MLHAVAIASAQAVVTTAETAAASSSPFTVANPGGQGVAVAGTINYTAGTGTTAVTVRVRQGVGTGGTLVGTAKTHTLAAGASASIPFAELDAANVAAVGQQYTVTIQATGASANGTINGGAITAQTATSAE